MISQKSLVCILNAHLTMLNRSYRKLFMTYIVYVLLAFAGDVTGLHPEIGLLYCCIAIVLRGYVYLYLSKQLNGR